MATMFAVGIRSSIPRRLASVSRRSCQLRSFQSISCARQERAQSAVRTVRQDTFFDGSAASGSASGGAVDEAGRIVLYCGPPAMKIWLYYLVGGTFVVIGFELAHNVYYHFTWPLFVRDPEGKPELVSSTKRTFGAIAIALVGFVTGALFFMVPSSNVTRLALDLPKRQLVIRTAVRGFSALPSRAIYPSALRKTAELRGYYLTPHNNERVVPLSSVYRIRGSASGKGPSSAITLRSKASVQQQQQQNLYVPDEKRSLEIKVGTDRFWYTVEAAGGASPSVRQDGPGRYARFWQRLSYWMRGSTDWSGVRDPPIVRQGGVQNSPSDGHHAAQWGEKEPWFSDRRTFDDVIPLVKRK